MKPISTLALLLLGTAALCSCQGSPSSAVADGATAASASPGLQRHSSRIDIPAASPLRKALVVAAVEAQPFAPTLEAPGVIEAAPERLVKIVPPLAGRIVRLHHQLGDRVKAGEPLVTIDSPDLGSAYRDDAKAQAALLQARQDFARQQALHQADISAGKDLEAARQTLTSAESDARAARERLAQLGAPADAASRREYVLRAPIAGRVVDMAGAMGGYWNDTTAAMMTVADLSTVWMSASVPEKDIAQLSVGQPVRIALDAYPGRVFEGKARYIGDLVDTDTRTVRVRVAIDNREGLFKPGMFAHATLQGPAQPALLVPASAVLQSGLATRVFVQTAPAQYESREVQVGPADGDRLALLAGLKPGERIVVQGGVLLND
ncbi:efflux RND transporter periplasmic adaptor subunit [Pseudacidovorax intermedius]|uniref:efflux RND transporter periplasmic adaptor subunit n=1 Tax=Pseudacidovorax intermedius TaxID=433924 RepID=UPI0009EAED21|nr:efflux RND transporter periplasmic adaptor subunit [Pseudacidovorax intermedius]